MQLRISGQHKRLLRSVFILSLVGCSVSPPQGSNQPDNYAADSARCRELALVRLPVKIPLGSYRGSQSNADIVIGENVEVYDRCMLAAGYPAQSAEPHEPNQSLHRSPGAGELNR